MLGRQAKPSLTVSLVTNDDNEKSTVSGAWIDAEFVRHIIPLDRRFYYIFRLIREGEVLCSTSIGIDMLYFQHTP